MGQLKNLREAVLVSFKASLKVKGSKSEDAISKARVDAEARFSDGAQEAVVTKGDPTWQWEGELRLLQEKI